MHYLNIQASGRDASRSNPNQKKILSSRKKLFPAAHFIYQFQRKKARRRSAVLPICCQNVVKTRNECKYMLFSPIAEYEKSPDFRAFSVVAAIGFGSHCGSVRARLLGATGTQFTSVPGPSGPSLRLAQGSALGLHRSPIHS